MEDAEHIIIYCIVDDVITVDPYFPCTCISDLKDFQVLEGL